MSEIEQFINMYVSTYGSEDATKRLRQLIEKYSDASAVMSPSEVSGFDTNKGCQLLMIGEGGEYGFYALTGNLRRAVAAAKSYMRDDCGMDDDYIKDAIETARKMKLHVYTKPWEEGELAEWYWYADDSEHAKAETVIKFSLQG